MSSENEKMRRAVAYARTASTRQVDQGAAERQRQQLKTIAVCVEEDLYTQLDFIAQLIGSNIDDEIRDAIEQRIITAQDDPEVNRLVMNRTRRLRSQRRHRRVHRDDCVTGTPTPGARSDNTQRATNQ